MAANNAMKGSKNKLIPTSDPLCQYLQDGHDDYSYGLLLSEKPYFIATDGEWMVLHDDRNQFANVHIIYEQTDKELIWAGYHVYGVRFWVKRCADCMGPYSCGECHGSCDGGE